MVYFGPKWYRSNLVSLQCGQRRTTLFCIHPSWLKHLSSYSFHLFHSIVFANPKPATLPWQLRLDIHTQLQITFSGNKVWFYAKMQFWHFVICVNFRQNMMFIGLMKNMRIISFCNALLGRGNYIMLSNCHKFL